eukprot:515498-Alexandrium_andersonii.AAC.1
MNTEPRSKTCRLGEAGTREGVDEVTAMRADCQSAMMLDTALRDKTCHRASQHSTRRTRG